MKCVILAAILACAYAAPRLADSSFQMPPALKDWIPDEKIVGGTAVNPNELPFQILMKYNGAFSCGGSIYNANTVITAAHCTRGRQPSALSIVTGEHRTNQNEGTEVTHAVSAKTEHPNYNGNTFLNDITLLRLATPIAFDNTAQPIALPPQGDSPATGTVVTVSGWGTTSAGGSVSTVLLSTDVDTVSDASCQSSYPQETIAPSMLCAARAGRDSCQGDSGGPLFTGTGSSATLYGVVSWGYGCADARYPGVYTQVSFFADWIAANA